MQGIPPLTTDHQLILECLEVLRLISERLETEERVETEDIRTVLAFLRDVGCECLAHTEHLLLRPALARARRREDIKLLRTALALHATIPALFDDTASDVTFPKHFVHHAHLLTKLIGDLIFEEDHYLLQATLDLLTDPEGQQSVEKFKEQEREISAIAAELSPTLRRIEMKYAYPRCI